MGQEESAGPWRGVRAGRDAPVSRGLLPLTVHRVTSEPESDRHRDREREAEKEGLGGGLTRQAEKERLGDAG